MSREITVAYAEPRLLAKPFHRLQTMKGIATHSPTALAAQQVRQHIHNRIDVRGNIKTPPHVVVTRVHNDREFFRRQNSPQAVNKLRASRPAGQDNNHAALRAYRSESALCDSFCQSSPLFAAARSMNSG